MMNPNDSRLCYTVSQQLCGLPRSRQAYENKVRSHVGGTGDIVFLCAPQEPNVMCLEDQDNNPVYACNHRIDTETGGMMVVLPPYRVTVLVFRAVGGLCEGVQGPKDDQHKPGHDGEDFVGKEVSLGKFLALGEWIVWRDGVSDANRGRCQRCIQSVRAIMSFLQWCVD